MSLCSRARVVLAALILCTSTARAQARFRETGTVAASEHVLWVRGTDAGTVLLYIARGYRDAFTHPRELPAADVQRWADSVDKLVAARHGPLLREELIFSTNFGESGVILERHIGGYNPGLWIALDGALALRVAEASAVDITQALESGAQVAYELTPAPTTVTVAQAAPPAASTTPPPAAEVPAQTSA